MCDEQVWVEMKMVEEKLAKLLEDLRSTKGDPYELGLDEGQPEAQPSAMNHGQVLDSAGEMGQVERAVELLWHSARFKNLLEGFRARVLREERERLMLVEAMDYKRRIQMCLVESYRVMMNADEVNAWDEYIQGCGEWGVLERIDRELKAWQCTARRGNAEDRAHIIALFEDRAEIILKLREITKQWCEANLPEAGRLEQ